MSNNNNKKEIKYCPKCGRRMAYHEVGGKRYYCGYCHYTIFLEKKR